MNTEILKDPIQIPLPLLEATEPWSCEIINDIVTLNGHTSQLNLTEILMNLKPWRKGPFKLNDILIDAEWQSNLKWRRIEQYLPNLTGKVICDIGANNGYYMYQMSKYNPEFVLGLEPYPLYVQQFRTLNHLTQKHHLFITPRGFDALPKLAINFDIIFCMGILYHHRSPLDILRLLRDSLSLKGTLILETIIYPGNDNKCITPDNHYAGMRNVFFLPTLACLQVWLKRCGFPNIECVDLSQTTPQEQRTTPWTKERSFPDFLDPENPDLTLEGYPAPLRATLICKRK